MDTSIPTHHLNFNCLSLLFFGFLWNRAIVFSQFKIIRIIALLDYLDLLSLLMSYIANWLHVKTSVDCSTI